MDEEKIETENGGGAAKISHGRSGVVSFSFFIETREGNGEKRDDCKGLRWVLKVVS